MVFRKAAIGAMVAASMVSAPVFAQAIQPVDAQVAARSGADMTAASEIGNNDDDRGGWLVPLLAILAIIAGILAATSGGNDDRPVSP